MAARSTLLCSAPMTIRNTRVCTVAILALLVPLMGCQQVKKLLGRGGNDAGAHTTAAPLGDAGGGSPVIALPNPNVAPLPSTAPMEVPTVADAALAHEDASAVVDDVVPAAPSGSTATVAVVDGGVVPTELRDPRPSRRRIDNYCKEHPGRVHPRTHVLCPM